MIHPMIETSDTVQAALEAGKPVVALESTIISHGMPYPRNVETALSVEQQVRDKAVMRAGVERDKERMRARKRQQQDAASGAR